MLKILQARLQQHMNHELPDVQAGFIKNKYIVWTTSGIKSFFFLQQAFKRPGISIEIEFKAFTVLA